MVLKNANVVIIVTVNSEATPLELEDVVLSSTNIVLT